MTTEITTSPAVLSLQQEQRRQGNMTESEKLNEALEATFPASDPISQSSGSVPSGRTNAAEAERVRKSKDETRGNRADVFGTIATAIRSRPATSIAIVAALAYIWRATR